MKKGEVYLVPYPFTDLQDFKIRPALILINFTNDATICYITSQISSFSAFDVMLQPSTANGLTIPSLIKTGRMVTISKKLFKARLGNISAIEIGMLDKNLKQLLQIK
jgi:mRNA interferase MazF